MTALGNKPYQPRIIKEACQFGDTLKSTIFYSEPWFAEFDGRIQKLEAIRQQQTEWKGALGLKSPTSLLEDLDEGKIDTILHGASEHHIELFDVPLSSAQSGDDMRVSNLIALRQRAKLQRAVEELPAYVQKLESALKEAKLDLVRMYAKHGEMEKFLRSQPGSVISILSSTDPQKSEAPDTVPVIPSAVTEGTTELAVEPVQKPAGMPPEPSAVTERKEPAGAEPCLLYTSRCV